MQKIEDKIDQISKDVSYLRGQYDSTVPEIRKMIEINTSKISDLEKIQSNMTGKVAMAGGLAGMLVTVVANWFIKH